MRYCSEFLAATGITKHMFQRGFLGTLHRSDEGMGVTGLVRNAHIVER